MSVKVKIEDILKGMEAQSYENRVFLNEKTAR